MSNVIINSYRFSGGPPFTNVYSLDFDGVDETYQTKDDIFEGVTNCSVSFWFKQDSLGATLNVFFSSGHSFAKMINMYTATDDTLWWVVQSGTSYSNLSNYTTAYPLGNWYHVLLVWDASESVNVDKLKLYIDGSLVTPTANYGTFPATTWTASLDYVNVGAFAASGGTPLYFFDGKIDEFAIWSTSLTSADSVTLYNGGSPTNLSTLAAPPDRWYRNGDSATYVNGNFEIPQYTKLDYWSSHSFDFNGIDETINCGNDNSLDLVGTDFSISFWINPDVTDSAILLENYLSGNGWGVWNNLGTMRFYDGTWRTFSVTLTNGVWQHILITGNTATNEVICYKDGGSADTQTLGTIATSASDLMICSQDNTGYYLNGKMDEISIFDSIKAPSDVSDGTKPIDISGESGLIGWWRMGENSYWNGTNWWIPDYSKNSLFSQKSLNFDGVGDYVSMGNVLDKDGTEAFSISTWVKYATAGTSMIVSKQDGSGYGFLLHTGIFSGQKIIWYPCIASGGNIQVRNSSAINDGNWHHILATYDGSGNASGAKIYIDGSLDTNIITDTFTGSSSSSGNLQISARNGPQFPFNGSQDDVAIFSSDKSASASSIYNSGVPSDLSGESGLEGYWTFDDATFSTNWNVPDNSSNSNDGTSSGMVETDLEFNTPTNPNAGLSSAMDLEDGMNSAPDNIHQGKSENMELADKSTDVP